MDLHVYLEERRQRVEAALDRWVPSETTPPEIVHRAMRYSLFAGGKRIRPVLCIAAGETIGGDLHGIEDAACALELVHTYSLIHDDLPALDNDDLRRGRPTAHKVFGEAIAILAGDALLTLAFQVLAQLGRLDPERKVQLVEELALAAGTPRGMIAGQVWDLEGERQQPTPELIRRIHRAKTGALIRASVRMGAIYAGASPEQLEALSRYGEHIGLAFQIVDDILDVVCTPEQLGKTPGKDLAQHKATFPAVYGVEQSRQLAEEELERAIESLQSFGRAAEPLRQLAQLIVHRDR